MYRVDWQRLMAAPPAELEQITQDAVDALNSGLTTPEAGASALVQLLGHKGDLMVIAFRRSFDDLGRMQLALSRTQLAASLVMTTSYVSIVELGMYEMTAKVHRML